MLLDSGLLYHRLTMHICILLPSSPLLLSSSLLLLSFSSEQGMFEGRREEHRGRGFHG